jgi:hypothetical protein
MGTKKINEMVDFYECSTKPSNLKIKIDDSQYKEFKGIYQDLKQHYLDSTTSLLNIIFSLFPS